MSYCRTNPKIQKAKNVHKTHEQNVIHYFFIYFVIMEKDRLLQQMSRYFHLTKETLLKL